FNLFDPSTFSEFYSSRFRHLAGSSSIPSLINAVNTTSSSLASSRSKVSHSPSSQVLSPPLSGGSRLGSPSSATSVSANGASSHQPHLPHQHHHSSSANATTA